MPVDFERQLWLFTAIIFVHNVFSATQDVAIDALAVTVLKSGELGLANGLMFGGNYVGLALGGSGVLLLTPVLGFKTTFLLVAGAIALVTILVPLPMREPAGPPRPRREGSPVNAVGGEIVRFVQAAAGAFVGSRAAFVAIFLALLPMGGYALSLSLQSNLAVELGLGDRQIGMLGLMSSTISAGFCVLGGWLSDRFGRRRTLALFIFGTTLPTFAMAMMMHRFHWIMPISPQARRPASGPGDLVAAFWALTLAYSVFQGLDVRHGDRDLHGRDQSARRRHAVHRLHVPVQPGLFLFLRVARTRAHAVGLSRDAHPGRFVRAGRASCSCP